MHYHEDWLMRQIMAAISILMKLITGVNSEKSLADPEGFIGDTGGLYLKLKELVSMGEIGRAEDLLFEAVAAGEESALRAAVLFYSQINALTDQELESCNFPRSEILCGLRELCKAYGIPQYLFDNIQ
ncbi:MAG: DUF6483 family protein [Christensenellales bacterium]|jgi:hypothetical protein